MRKELRPEDLTAIIDTREELPYNLFPMTEVTEGLATGDYSVKGLERYIAVERKSLSDFLGCVGTHRERFDAERLRMLAYPHRCLVIEATWQQIVEGKVEHYGRSRVHPNAAAALVQRWQCDGIPVMLAGSRDAAQRFVVRFLFLAAKSRWDEALSLLPTMRIDP